MLNDSYRKTPPRVKTFPLSHFANKERKQATVRDHDWTSLVEFLSTCKARETKDGALWSPATFKNDLRNNDNVESLSVLGIDIDHNAPELEDLRNKLDTLKCNYIVYSSWGHKREYEDKGKLKNFERSPRWRVAIPLENSVNALEYQALWRWTEDKLGLEFDRNSKDPARIYFSPQLPHEYLATFEHHAQNSRPWFDIDDIYNELEPVIEELAAATVATTLQYLPVSAEQVENLLDRALKFPYTKSLFDRDISEYDDDSSKADLALCNKIRRTSPDHDQPFVVDALFRRSELFRKKWDAKRGQNTYGQNTIAQCFSTPVHLPYLETPIEPVTVLALPDAASKSLDALYARNYGTFAGQDFYTGPQVLYGLGRGELGYLLAVSNRGKSTLLRNLCLSMATGRDNFQPLLIPGNGPQKVVYFDGEDTDSRAQAELNKMVAGMSPTHEELELLGSNFFQLNPDVVGGKLNKPEAFAYLRDFLLDLKPALLVVDTMTSSMPFTSINDNDEWDLKNGLLADLAKDTGAVVLYSHQIGKARFEEGATRESVHMGKGGSSQAELPRGGYALKLNPTTGKVILAHAKPKGVPFPDAITHYDAETSWVTLDSWCSARQTPYEKVIACVRSGVSSTRDIIKKTGLPKTTVHDQLNHGDRAKAIHSKKHGTWLPGPNSGPEFPPSLVSL